MGFPCVLDTKGCEGRSPLSGHLLHVSGDGGAGAGPAVVAVVPLGGAIRVRHPCYPGRHARLQVWPSHYLLVHLWRAVGSAMWCRGEAGGWLWPWFRAVRGRWPSTRTGAGGGRATQPTRRARAPCLGWGSGPLVLGGHRVVPGGAAQGEPP